MNLATFNSNCEFRVFCEFHDLCKLQILREFKDFLNFTNFVNSLIFTNFPNFVNFTTFVKIERKDTLCYLQRSFKFQIVNIDFSKDELYHLSWFNVITNHFSSSATQRNVLNNATSYEYQLAVFSVATLAMRVANRNPYGFQKSRRRLMSRLWHSECIRSVVTSPRERDSKWMTCKNQKNYKELGAKISTIFFCFVQLCINSLQQKMILNVNISPPDQKCKLRMMIAIFFCCRVTKQD